MELKEAFLKAKETGLSLTRRGWMAQNIISFVIHPTGSMLGTLMVHNLYEYKSPRKESKAEPIVGKLFSPTENDIIADDWELVKLIGPCSKESKLSMQHVVPVLVETH